MKTITLPLVVLASISLLLTPAAFAQRELGKKKGPTSKLYLAETVGKGAIVNEGKSYEPKQATAFDAPGTIIQTEKEAHQAFVYSNGTGMFVDEDTRVEVDRFVQEPFKPERNNTEVEPSISQSDVFISRGTVGLCTGQLVSGTTMNYGTPHANVNIRGGKIAINASPEETTIYLLEGDATARSGTKDVGGTLLRAGEKATIRPGPPGQPPVITVAPIEPEMMGSLDEKVTVACNARKTVSFEVIEKKAQVGLEPDPDNPPTEDPDPEIVPKPTIPLTPDNNITVSPSEVNP